MEPFHRRSSCQHGTKPDEKLNVTQRGLISVVFAAYDPIGLVAVYTIQARLLLEYICLLSGKQWDDNLPPDLVTKFLEWSKEISTLSDITILRAYFAGELKALELHLSQEAVIFRPSRSHS